MIPILLALSTEFKLLERAAQTSNILLIIIIISFTLVGWSGMRTNGFIGLLIKNFIRIMPKESEFKESLKINFGASFLLFLNLIISLSICFFLLISKYISFWESCLLASISSIVFIFLQQFGFRFVSLLTGDIDLSEGFNTINRNTWQFGGILILIFSTIWTLNMKYNELMSYCFIALLFILLLTRMIKALFLSFKKRIPWYYFILYFCTLEILPAFILLRLAIGVFHWKM